MCCRVQAETKEDALVQLKDFLVGIRSYDGVSVHDGSSLEKSIEYCNVYINEDHITLKDISDAETEGIDDG
jgi:hypothetical protein